MIVSTYPFFNNSYFAYCNETIRTFSRQYNIPCVDYAQYFSYGFSDIECQTMFNKFHPNNKGHLYMGISLSNFLINRTIIENLKDTDETTANRNSLYNYHGE